MKRLERVGVFRGRARSWCVRRTSNGKVIIRVGFEVFEMLLEDGAWRKGSSAEVDGDFFPFKATGAPNEKIAEMLCETLGWGGTFAELSETPPLDAVVQVEVKSREHNGKHYFSVDWIRAGDADPKKRGGAEDLEATEVVELDKKHAAAMRGVVSKVKRATDAGEVEKGGAPF